MNAKIGALGNKVEAAEATYYTAEEAAAYNTENELSEGDEGYKSEGDIKTEEVVAVPHTVKSYVEESLLGGIKIVKISQSDYSTITKDPNTLYVITED